jgi:hypothetical protein
MMTARRREVHSAIFLFGLLLLAAGLPLSKLLMSIGQMILLGNWILEGGFSEKWHRLKNSWSAVLLLSVFLFLFAGLLWSDDMQFGLQDLKIKLPLALLPLLFATSRHFHPKFINWVYWVFIHAVLAKTIQAYGVYMNWWGHAYIDVRDITQNISSIRLSLMIVFSAFLYVVLLRNKMRFVNLFSFIITFLWFIYFLLLIRSLTGFVCLGLVASVTYFISLFSKRLPVYSLLIGAAFLLCLVFFSYRTYRIYTDYFIPKPVAEILDSVTAKGNRYDHDIQSTTIENGYRTWLFVSWKELAESWNERSDLHLGMKDKKGNEVTYTLIRFLTSKGLRKDASGVEALTEEEIKGIESGVANALYLTADPFTSRVHQVIWEFDVYFNHGGNPSGHSVTQRIEFWKTGLGILKDHLWTGVGTGDTRNAYEKAYVFQRSALTEKYRLRSHNQFLAIALAIGLPGLILFIISLIYPLRKNFRNWVYLCFFLILSLSFITEDTLETQAGVTFYAFFNSLLIFAPLRDKPFSISS